MKQKKDPEIKIDLSEFYLQVVKSPSRDESFLTKSAWFIGTAAGWIHRIVSMLWFRILFAAAALYFLMHWTGVSIGIYLHNQILFLIR